MPAAHFMRFWAAYKIEPFGELREDIRQALVCQWLAVIAGNRQRLQVKAFVIDWWKPPPTPEEEEARIIAQLDSSFGSDGWEEAPDG